MRLYPVLRVLAVLCTISMLLVTLAGCTLLIGDAHIRGTIYGDPLLDKLSMSPAPVALAATVRCNGVLATANSTGKYDLKLPVSEQYHCEVSAPRNYVSQSVTLRSADVNLELDFGPTNLSPSCVQIRANTQCTTLHLKTGNITGTVTYHGGSVPAADSLVQCTNAAVLQTTLPLAIDPSVWPSARTIANGTFTIANIQPGLYDCYATASSGDMQHARAALAPGQTTSLDFSVCGTHCNPVHYHGGPVMHTYTAYLIFWLPKPSVFEPSGDDARFESSMAQYFRDVGGTSFYGLLTQYWDYHGAVKNSAQLGDVYVDTTPYDRCDSTQTRCSSIPATQQQPLLDADIHGEIERAVHAHPFWHTDLNSEFFVFTGYNAEECESGNTQDGCTFTSNAKNGYCGYHDAFNDEYPNSTLKTPLIYSYIPDAATHCLWKNDYIGPHNDNLIDEEISVVSHEQFESVTDPLPQHTSTLGWLDDVLNREGEIGDKCVSDYGTIQSDGSDVTLGNGHTYILQTEWSNRANRCSLS